MSAGKFTLVRYASEWSSSPTFLHPIRVQPETLAAQIGSVTNAAPTTGSTCPISARVGSNKRQFGLVPRTVTLRSPATNPPSGYAPDSLTVIPALTVEFYNAAVKGVPCDYLGVAFTVAGRSPERTN